MFEAWNAGDLAAELYDPDVIVRNDEGWPEPGPFVGREAVMGWFEQIREAWDADALEPIGDFIDAADHVVVKLIWRGVGQGPESSMEFTGIYKVRKRRIVYIEFFWDYAKALETLGLSEQAMSRENAAQVELERRDRRIRYLERQG
jgi:ketosteroid isomerase-like protein